jgi:hypothetical protein
MEATAVRFAAAVRALGTAARRQGLVVPAFRSPPRVEGADRTLRHRRDGTAVVAVRRRGRPFTAVLADLVEGVVVANDLDGVRAAGARSALWATVESAGLVTAPVGAPPVAGATAHRGDGAPVRGLPAPATPAADRPLVGASSPTGADHAGRVARRPSLRAVPTPAHPPPGRADAA